MLRYWTAGESHGPALIALVDGFPAGLAVDKPLIDAELVRRQGGYGRGGRQRIETDAVTFLSGLWRGTTLGSPLALEVVNKDAKLEKLEDVDRPRPGHADLAGAVKHLGGVRAVLERASARETAARVAAGALARQLLAVFGIEVGGWVTELGGVVLGGRSGTLPELRALRDASEIYSLHPERDAEVTSLIDRVGKEGDTLGGVVEVRVDGLSVCLSRCPARSVRCWSTWRKKVAANQEPFDAANNAKVVARDYDRGLLRPSERDAVSSPAGPRRC